MRASNSCKNSPNFSHTLLGAGILKGSNNIQPSGDDDPNREEWCCLSYVSMTLNYEITNRPDDWTDAWLDPNYEWPDEICYKGSVRLSSDSDCYIDLVKCKGTTRYGFANIFKTTCDDEWKMHHDNEVYHMWNSAGAFCNGYIKLPCCAVVKGGGVDGDQGTSCSSTSQWEESREVSGCIPAMGDWSTTYINSITPSGAKRILNQVAETHWLQGTNPPKVKLCCSNEFTTNYEFPPWS